VLLTGVHAARIVVSAKLLLAPEWLHDPQEEGSVDHENENDMGAEKVQRVPALVEQLNQLLPPAVRAFSCTRVNQGFQAREACHWRCVSVYHCYLLIYL
jgi:tRNA U38,U39,U40 pseudouridine synthase TruA